MKYEAIVWDLDGTLTHSLPGIMRSCAYALTQSGYPVPEEAELMKYAGPPLLSSFKEFAGMSDSKAENAVKLFRSDYVENGGVYLSSVFPGIRQLLYTLKKNGAYMAIVTGKAADTAVKVLRHFHIEHFFDRVIGSSAAQREFRKQDAINEVLKIHRNVVMIGDRIMDIEGAAVCGVPSILAGYGYAQPGEFDALSPDFTADTVNDLYALLGVQKAVDNGIFVTMEGNDGCGKSTQIRALEKRLAECGFDLLKTREPGGTPISEKIRNILLDRDNSRMEAMTEALLFAAARAQHVREVILPALGAGRLVLSDRFVDSSIAYQGAGRELGEDEVEKINSYATAGLVPDYTVYLDVDCLEAMRRRVVSSSPDRIELLNDTFHERVQKAFRRLLARFPERFIRVDASKRPEDTAKAIFDELIQKIENREKELCAL